MAEHITGNFLDAKRFVVRIFAGSDRLHSKCVYYRTNLPYAVLNKWMWYFKYREARYRVEYPKYHIELDHSSYDIVIPQIRQVEALNNQIRAKKAYITKINNRLMNAKKNWTEIFPIVESEPYIEAVRAISTKHDEIKSLENKLYEVQHDKVVEVRTSKDHDGVLFENRWIDIRKL